MSDVQGELSEGEMCTSEVEGGHGVLSAVQKRVCFVLHPRFAAHDQGENVKRLQDTCINRPNSYKAINQSVQIHSSKHLNVTRGHYLEPQLQHAASIPLQPLLRRLLALSPLSLPFHEPNPWLSLLLRRLRDL
jgi:hypothetical protein